MTIKEICKKYSLSQTALAKRFNIPLRTVQDWHSEKRIPPEYIASMIEELLEMEETTMTKTYSVTLSNRDYIFDDHSGFASIEEAIAWATGRGYSYVAYFDVDGGDGLGISVSCDSDNNFSVYNGVEWMQYSTAKLAAYLKRNL